MIPLLFNKNGDPPVSRLMTIPVELRLKIWRLLLLAWNVRILDSSKQISNYVQLFEFAMPLLCTCRQIYEEAASVLYNENFWMFFTEENALNNKDGWAFYSDGPRSQFVTWNQAVCLPDQCKLKGLVKNPNLKVDISYSDLEMSKMSHKYQYAIAFDRYLLPQLCGLISKRALETGIKMTLSLREHSVMSRLEKCNLLLLPFKAVRGLHEVTVRGAVSKTVVKDLKRTMKSSFRSYSELEEILRDYKNQGNALFEEKRYGEAKLV